MNKFMSLPGYLMFGLSLAHGAQGPAPTPNRVLSLDAAKPAANAKELPAVWSGIPKHPVFFGAPLEFRLEGLSPAATYRVRATFVTDVARTTRVIAGDVFLENALQLSPGKTTVREWTLPSGARTAALLFQPLEGPNVTLASLEVFSDDARPVSLSPSRKPVDATPARLDALTTATPRISPRPVSVSGVKSAMLPLNGVWRFSTGGAAQDDSPEIRVPGEWAMQGFTVPAGREAEYLLRFDLPADWSGKNVRLRFDAVHASCEILLNGKRIGGHEGGFVPFEIDATSAAKPGASNEIRVRVRCESVADSIACMSQYAAHPVGGIIRKVAAFAVPRTNLATLTTNTRFDEAFRDATLEIASRLEGPAGGATLDHTLVDAAGKIVAEARGVQAGELFSLAVKAPAHWTNESPTLYTLITTLHTPSGDERVERRIGFRQVSVKGNQVLLNGVPIKLFGVCRHEISPVTGRSLSPELCRKDAEIFRAGNANFIRTSHYPPSEEFLDACDEQGLLVEAEAAVCWIKHNASPVWQTWNNLDERFFPYLLRANLDNLAANRDHPSVIIWSTANESFWTPLFAKVDEVMRREDPGRPTSFHDQHWGDYNNGHSTASIAVYHYPSEANPELWSAVGRPMQFGEYAHVECYNRRELETDPAIRSDWGRGLARMSALMRAQPGCLGGSIWSGLDDVFRMPDGDLRGYGHWGVIDGWRRLKPEWYGMREAFAPVRFEAQKPVGGKLRVHIENLRDFTPVTSVVWHTASASGTLATNIPPHGAADIEIPVQNAKPGETCDLEVARAGGGPAHAGRFPLGEDAPHAAPGSSIATSTPEISESDSALGLSFETASGRVECRIDKATGDLRVSREGRVAIDGRLSPAIIALDGSGGASGPAGSVLSNTIEPLTTLGAPAGPVSVSRVPGETAVKITRAYEDCLSEIRIVVAKGSTLKIEYTLGVTRAVNPRQWGLEMTVPGRLDTLRWNSPARAGVFGPDEIGRPSGNAKAAPSDRSQIGETGRDLAGTRWASDANALGTNDFRSSKIGADFVTLDDGANAAGVAGKFAATRAHVDGDAIRLLVAGFNTGGADGFYSTHYSAERRPLKAGDKISGEFAVFVASAPAN